jgi:aspartate 1-decarboxylase
MITLLKSKLHRARVTFSDLNYEGSITIDPELMEAANLLHYEKVDVLNINNGSRFTTYVIEGKRGSGDIGINGAAARMVQKDDLVIICAYISMDEEQGKSHKPTLVMMNSDDNSVKSIN